MFRIFKFFHYIGLTMYLGSIWVYISQRTPIESELLLLYSRENVSNLVLTVTLPGLLLILVSGLLMVTVRRSLLGTRFFKIKAAIGTLILFNCSYIIYQVKKSAIAASQLPEHFAILKSALLMEVIFGTVNILFALFLIGYSLAAKKYCPHTT